MDWRLRRAGAGDAPALSLVAGASFLETFAGILTGDDIVAHVTAKSAPAIFAGWAADPATVVMLATHPHGDAPVGYTVLTTPDDVGDIAPGDVELRRIYTLSTARGTGLGTARMDRAVADAQGLGATRMLLGVFAGNSRARTFYERHGFILTATRRFKVGASFNDDCIYARTL